METIIKLNNQTAGRDKIIRLLQYGSRACWYYSQSLSKNSSHSVNMLKSLEYAFSTCRKLLRLGRCLDNLHLALSYINYPGELVVRITLTLSKITNSLFLLADHIIWMGRSGIFKVNLEKWGTIANKYWLMTIIFNLTRDVYEIFEIVKNQKYLTRKDKLAKHLNYPLKKQMDVLKCCFRDRQDVILDTCKNGCDLFIPLTSLGYTKLNPGLVGILGFISSAVGIYALVYPVARLTPS